LSFWDNDLSINTYILVEGNTVRLSGYEIVHTSTQGWTGHEMPQMLCGEPGGAAILP